MQIQGISGSVTFQLYCTYKWSNLGESTNTSENDYFALTKVYFKRSRK